jgi:hypothetical protein
MLASHPAAVLMITTAISMHKASLPAAHLTLLATTHVRPLNTCALRRRLLLGRPRQPPLAVKGRVPSSKLTNALVRTAGRVVHWDSNAPQVRVFQPL